MDTIVNSEFEGYIICEYEDELYCGGTEFTKRQVKMLERILEK